ncbi:alpha-galactosidase [Thermocatellispora tengchongensis]|uniref:alpha-galactosidase n=1 Tax=Thermocatellispora tengchongensis TaxID=1073253 RepID=A0A840P3B4_9ACTN|nr:alpha-galactosidase [Thermocatellispora tengchongensis]MBB5131737.1 alpha-galactosidase [Thermocatellispora tengchongensis]
MTEPLILRADGTALVLDPDGPGLPRVLHWGPALGPLDGVTTEALAAAWRPARLGSSPPLPPVLSLLPGEHEGWQGRPGVAGHRDGRMPHLRLLRTGGIETDPAAGSVLIRAEDAEAGVATVTELRLEPQGVVRLRHTLTNLGEEPWTAVAPLTLLPVPDHAGELMDWTGRWGRERHPQRSPFHQGIRSLESRRGRTGHGATGLLVAGTPGFGFRHGEVWAVHLAWSGNHQHYAERLAEGWSVIGAGELLAPGEVRLAPGESYESPWAFFVYSEHGLDGASARLHRWLRARPGHPRSPRPVVLNTWEAVYFDQRPDHLLSLAERAAHIGVERFVLDDGWFRGRRDDSAGLGDWYVAEDVWPKGLHPLADRVRELGMQFGLWVEPEMVNLDSDLARAHPEWLLAAPGRTPREWRRQHTLDLAVPEAFAHILDRLDALVTEYRIDYLKWDHNRDLLEAVHDGGAGVREQTLAVYRLLDRLRERHPRLEIESCSSGGARIDLGILARSDRVWASDTNDPLDRQDIQRWLSVLVPPELIGSHVGPPVAHVTGRAAGLPFRAATALFCHAGLEWDLTTCDPAELDYLRLWLAEYKRLRPLLHTGEVVRIDPGHRPELLVHGVVAADRSHALFAGVTTATSPYVAPPRLRLAGLDEHAVYDVTPLTRLTAPDRRFRQPSWADGGTTLPGALLMRAGLAAPLLNPSQAMLVELRAR